MHIILLIHIGQAGIQLGNACWELFCLEHGLKNDRHFVNEDTPYNDNFTTFFAEIKENEFVPRSVFIDLEPAVIDEVKRGINSELFLPEQFISGKEDAASIYSRGYYTIGKEIVDESLDRIRKIVENCIGFQGFLVFNSVGGGTGSGFSSLLLERLSVDYGGKPKISFPIYPSSTTSTSVVEPYNSVFATHKLIEHSDAALILDNKALYDICNWQLAIDKPTYTSINSLTSQAISSITLSMRAGGALNADPYEIKNNMVPYPRIHFLFSSYAPLFPSTCTPYSPNCSEITSRCFEPIYMMAKCDPGNGKYMAISLMYRGDVVPKDVSASIAWMKSRRSINFVDWCPTGLKCGINYESPTVIIGGDIAKMSRSALMVCNHTAISEVFSRINGEFDLMYKKKAFVHWYTAEGMEESEFAEAREDLAELQADYKECASDNVDEDTAEDEG